MRRRAASASSLDPWGLPTSAATRPAMPSDRETSGRNVEHACPPRRARRSTPQPTSARDRLSLHAQGRASRAGAAAGARFARVLAAPRGRGPGPRRSAPACGPSYEDRGNINYKHRGGRGRGARHRRLPSDAEARSAVANDSYGRGSVLACQDNRQRSPVERPSRQSCDSFAVTPGRPCDSCVTLGVANHGGERRILAITRSDARRPVARSGATWRRSAPPLCSMGRAGFEPARDGL